MRSDFPIELATPGRIRRLRRELKGHKTSYSEARKIFLTAEPGPRRERLFEEALDWREEIAKTKAAIARALQIRAEIDQGIRDPMMGRMRNRA